MLRRRMTSVSSKPNEKKEKGKTNLNKENRKCSKNVVVAEEGATNKENNGGKRRAAAKENIKKSKKLKKEKEIKKKEEPLPMMSPTPYYKIVMQRGGEMSPRITRSSVKKKKMKDEEDEPDREDGEDDDNIGLPKGVVLSFSPPNQVENARREKEEVDRKLKARNKRVGNCKDKGNLLIFSPGTLRPYQYFADEEPPQEKQSKDREKHKQNKEKKEDLIEQMSVGIDKSPNVTLNELDQTLNELEVTMQRSPIEGQVSGTASMGEQSQQQDITAELKSLREAMNKLVKAQTTKVDTENVDSERANRADKLALEAHLMRSETLMSANDKLEMKNEKLEDAVKSLATKLSEEKEIYLIEKTRLEAKLDASERESTIRIEGLEQSGQKLEEQLLKLEHEKGILIRQVEDLRKQLEETKVKLEKAEKQIMLVNQHESEKEQSKSKEENHTDLLENLQAANCAKLDLEGKLSSKVTAINEYKKKIIQLEEKLQYVMKELETQQQDMDMTNKKCDEYENEIEKLKKDIQNAAKEKEAEGKHYEKITEENRSILDRMRGEAKEKESQINALTEQVYQLEKDLEKKKESCGAINSELENIQEELKNRAHVLERALEETTIELEEAKQINSSLEGKLDRALKQVKATAAVNEIENSLAMERKLKQQLEQSKQKLEVRNTELEAQTKELEDTVKDLERKIKEIGSVKDDVVKDLEKKINDLHSVKDERDKALVLVERYDHEKSDMSLRLQESHQIRRDLHSRVMQLSGNIRVYIRVRPFLPGENEDLIEELSKQKGKKKRRRADTKVNDCPFYFPGMHERRDEKRKALVNNTVKAAGADDMTKNIIEIQEPYKDRGGLSDRRKKWRYGFDNIFSPDNGQEEIWEATEPLIQSAIDGYNVTVFAYGQTGTGKTYTMLGEPGKEGIIGRAVKMLFNSKKETEELYPGTNVSVSVELLEVYNDQVLDLLAQRSSDRGTPLKINVDKDVVGNVVVPASNEKDVMDVLGRAQKRRCVKSTACNAESSRSHMIFTLHFEVTMSEGIKRIGRLNICDLAGSERLSKSGAHDVGGDLLKETKCINASLSVLSNVIEKLQAGSSNIPYRESKLTHLLQNSLGGNSKTLAIICCNPSGAHFHESLCSLKFAAKVNRVELKDMANFSC